MAFGSYVSSSFKERGFEVFDHNMNFDEGKILRDHAEKIKKEMQIDQIEFIELNDIQNIKD